MRVLRAQVNGTQRLILGFVIVVWLCVVAILMAAPQTYDGAAGVRTGGRWLVDLGILVLLSIPLALLALAVVRRWRWAFWLVLMVFFAGLLRVPAAALELTGRISTRDPAWYVMLQAVLGVVQFLLAIAMVAGYRRSGVWGDFRSE